ncbi:DUF3857 domain-containing protein [Autumnicola psychrophila]|uniref:DUF3857 domain-containing protein n=1 Tax=Autumnicola psychrophila TaxID=3075592 RepID=A0ABU3DMU6_9FLAO|nr:DUF3857 domain-containing protein [Zunongwangia sp. F225]MDT0685039.1 DUF3857 domain-containing protein [Zunongwangia sp. F225]
MILRKFSVYTVVLFFLVNSAVAQDFKYQSFLLDSSLTANSHAIIRENLTEVEVLAVDKMLIRRKKIVTVLNKKGDGYALASTFYDDNRKIKHQEAYIFNSVGKEIQHYKERDFKDQSAVGGANLHSDDRISYLDYTPRSYPYTILFESEVVTNTTIFIPPWQPVYGYNASIENSSYRLLNPAKVPFRFEERNFEGFSLSKKVSEYELFYSVSKIPAYVSEKLAPDLEHFTPKVLIALNDFSLVGVTGHATNWSELGKWQFDNLLRGRDRLPEETISKIAVLTKDAKTLEQKARIIYNYVQEKTRYISVQLGIGGWEPMPSEDVDKLGYGDCKALTNYTKALLESQDILSNYAVVYAGEEKRNIDSDFASMQGTHVILNIPDGEEDIWLECTSQTMPFNYLGDFTDDRNVLLVKPEGGEIVRTKTYTAPENLRESNTKIILKQDGSFETQFLRQSNGVFYGNIYQLKDQKAAIQDIVYKEDWGHLQDLKIESIQYNDDKDKQQFVEELSFTGQKYGTKAGKRLLLPVSFLNLKTFNTAETKERKLPLEIRRGETIVDYFSFLLPEGFEVESIPQSANITSEFGSLDFQLNVIDGGDEKKIEVIRSYQIKKGSWPAEKYQKFRDFISEVNHINNQKAVIITNL